MIGTEKKDCVLISPPLRRLFCIILFGFHNSDCERNITVIASFLFASQMNEAGWMKNIFSQRIFSLLTFFAAAQLILYFNKFCFIGAEIPASREAEIK